MKGRNKMLKKILTYFETGKTDIDENEINLKENSCSRELQLSPEQLFCIYIQTNNDTLMHITKF